jgi:hypothetical protein
LQELRLKEWKLGRTGSKKVWTVIETLPASVDRFVVDISNDAREETILKRADIQSELAEWTKAWCGRVIDVKSEAAEVAIVTLPVCASRISIKVSSVGEHIYIPLEDPGADVILK